MEATLEASLGTWPKPSSPTHHFFRARGTASEQTPGMSALPAVELVPAATVDGCRLLHLHIFWVQTQENCKILGVPSPFLAKIILSRKPPETQENGRFLKTTMIEKNGESTPGKFGFRANSPLGNSTKKGWDSNTRQTQARSFTLQRIDRQP